MRLRTLLATAVVGTLIAGATGMTAQAQPASSPAKAGTVVTWGNAANTSAAAAMAVPTNFTAPVAAMATTSRAAAAVLTDGTLRVWGTASLTALEVADAPQNVTDAVAVALVMNAGVVLHRDGTVTGWGNPALADDVPAGLRAKAITLQGGGTAYAVTTEGTVVSWGPGPLAPPSGLTDVVDVTAGNFHVVARKADGSVVAWRNHSDDPVAEAGLAPLDVVPDFGGKKVVAMDAGTGGTAVALDDGSVDVWGSTVPSGEPDFGGKKVVDINLDGNVGAVTEDGTVFTWGTANTQINTNRPAALTGKPVASIVLGAQYAAVIVTSFRELTAPTVTGTPEAGRTLTATPGTLSLTPDSPAAGQWYAGAEVIAGQTGATLMLDPSLIGKTISYKSTAVRGDVTVTSTSNEVGPVTLAASTTTLTVAPAKGAYGTARTALATVAKNVGTATGTVTFKVGSTETTVPLTEGAATLALPKTLPVGTQTVTASYQGDAATAASASAAASVTVSKAASKVSAKAKATGKTKKVAKKVTVTITVKTAAGVSPAGKVTVTLKGSKKVTAKVNAKGKATVTFKKVKRGKHKATVSYAGNATVNSAKATITVKA